MDIGQLYEATAALRFASQKLQSGGSNEETAAIKEDLKARVLQILERISFFCEARQTDAHTLELQHLFDTADDGFPGALTLRLTYRLTEHNELVIEHEATAVEGHGPASFTCHAFFNLDGPGHARIDGHRLEVRASQLLATDADNIPTGERTPLRDHPLDLRDDRDGHQTPFTGERRSV